MLDHVATPRKTANMNLRSQVRAVIALGAIIAASCEDDVTAPSQPVGPSEVGSVLLLPDSLTVAVYDTAQLTVIVRDTTGAVIANPHVVFSVNGLMVGTVDSTGLVTGLPGGCGVGTIIARSRGVNSNTVHIKVGSPSGAGCWDY